MATWTPEPGEKVAVWFHNGWRDPSVSIVTVERLTSTQIVIEGSDTRYRRDTLEQTGDRYASELRPADDTDVQDLLVRQRLRNVKARLCLALETAERNLRQQDNPTDALAVLDEIDQVVSTARAAIQKLED